MPLIAASIKCDEGRGTRDAGDSLAAIKKPVFDEKKISMAELCNALDHSFEGHDGIHGMCSEVAKFGNDNEMPMSKNPGCCTGDPQTCPPPAD